MGFEAEEGGMELPLSHLVVEEEFLVRRIPESFVVTLRSLIRELKTDD